MKLKLCIEPNCNRFVTEAHSSFCPIHKAIHDKIKSENAFKTATKYADYNNSQWRNLRASILKERKSCQKCGSTYRLQVHHIIPVRTDPAQFLNPNNLIVLCTSCHTVETQREIQNRKR